MARRILKITLFTLLVLISATALWIGMVGKDLFHTATGSVSRSLCAAAFVSQVDPQQIFQEEQLPLMRSIGWAIQYCCLPLLNGCWLSLLPVWTSWYGSMEFLLKYLLLAG